MIFGQKEELVYLGREIGEQRDYSESVAEEIDEEVRRIVGEAYEKCRTVLTEHRDKLDLVAKTLLEIETLDQEAFIRLMEGTPEDPPQNTPPQAAPGSEKKSRKSKGSEDASSALDLPPAPAPA
jgi:cell division protease FtsH